VLGVLTDPLPIISDLIGPTSIVDVAAALLPAPYDAIPRAIDALGFVVDTAAQLVGAAEAQAGNSTVLHFGERRFGTPETSGFDARDANQAIDLAADQTDSDLVSQLLDAAGRGVPGSFGALSQQVIDTEGASFDFPFLKQPLSVFEFLLGIGDAEIVTFTFPSIDGTIPFDLTVPIFLGILKAGIFGGIDVHASLAVGYDTFGFREFARTGSVADLSRGFYISDRENADGTGEDIAEFSIGGDILAGLVLDAVVASAGVGGGVFAELNADFIDDDNDGKIRGHELVPHEGCLELEGTIGVKLEAFVELLGFIRKDFPFARAELGGFNTTVPCFGGADDANETGDRIAELDSDGVLKLFIGPDADRRRVRRVGRLAQRQLRDLPRVSRQPRGWADRRLDRIGRQCVRRWHFARQVVATSYRSG
jgi:hypothetical protein